MCVCLLLSPQVRSTSTIIMNLHSLYSVLYNIMHDCSIPTQYTLHRERFVYSVNRNMTMDSQTRRCKRTSRSSDVFVDDT